MDLLRERERVDRRVSEACRHYPTFFEEPKLPEGFGTVTYGKRWKLACRKEYEIGKPHVAPPIFKPLRPVRR